jgi:hypothetical protein
MTEEQIKEALSQCFNDVVQEYFFEQDTEENRQLIVYNFIDKCAEFGHGIGAESIVKDGSFKGVEFIHEKGLHGTIMIRVSVEHGE